MSAICPHCQQPLLNLQLVPLEGSAPNGTTWNCLAFCCPRCRKALSADIDLTAVRADIIGTIEHHLTR